MNCRQSELWVTRATWERSLFAVLVMLGLSGAVSGCGGAATQDGETTGASGQPASEGPSGGAPGSGGHATTGGSSPGATASCPTIAPENGSACTLPTPACTWDDDPRPACRTGGACCQGVWNTFGKTDLWRQRCSVPALPAACPAAPAAMGSACTDDGLDCTYDDGTDCWCSSAQWTCSHSEPVEVAAGCLDPLPQVGSPCTQPRLGCSTSKSSSSTNETTTIWCDRGLWQVRDPCMGP